MEVGRKQWSDASVVEVSMRYVTVAAVWHAGEAVNGAVVAGTKRSEILRAVPVHTW